ncbi:hypothetical protein MRX96_032951 [Rhipicephalus microplus]
MAKPRSNGSRTYEPCDDEPRLEVAAPDDASSVATTDDHWPLEREEDGGVRLVRNFALELRGHQSCSGIRRAFVISTASFSSRNARRFGWTGKEVPWCTVETTRRKRWDAAGLVDA